MSATVQVHRITGPDGSPIDHDITSTNTRALAADVHSVAGTINGVVIPLVGHTNYSFWIHTRLYVVSGLVGTLNNIIWFTDGAVGLGNDIGAIGMDATDYEQATGQVGISGDQLTQGADSYLTAAPASLSTFTAGSPKSIPGSLTASNGYVGNYMVYQITVGSTASPGASSSTTFTWQYDET